MMRTILQKSADEIDMDLCRLEHRLDRMFIGSSASGSDWTAAKIALGTARNRVRIYMHPEDRKASE